jgi:hypothetical protein
MPSSGTWRREVLVRNVVSEERIFSIIRVEGIRELAEKLIYVTIFYINLSRL